MMSCCLRQFWAGHIKKVQYILSSPTNHVAGSKLTFFFLLLMQTCRPQHALHKVLVTLSNNIWNPITEGCTVFFFPKQNRQSRPPPRMFAEVLKQGRIWTLYAAASQLNLSTGHLKTIIEKQLVSCSVRYPSLYKWPRAPLVKGLTNKRHKYSDSWGHII